MTVRFIQNLYLRNVMPKSWKEQGSVIVVLNYVGRLLSAVNTFVLLPSALGMERLGLYAGIHHIVFLLARVNLGQSVVRYGARRELGKSARRALLAWICTVSTLFYVVVMVICWLGRSYVVAYFAPKAPDLANYFPLIVFMGYVVVMSVTLKAWYISLGEVWWPSLLQHVMIHLLLIAWVVAYNYRYVSFRLFLYGSAAPYLLDVALLLWDLSRRGALGIAWDRQWVQRAFVIDFGVYSLVTLISGSMAMVMMRVDNIMVLAMCGKEIEAMYHTVASLALLLEVPMKVVKQVYASRIVQLLAQQDHRTLGVLYRRTTLLQLALTSLSFSLLYACIDYLLYVFPQEEVGPMKILFLFLGGAKLIESVCRMGAEILLLSRHFAWSILGIGFLLLGTCGNYLLIHRFGMYGAAMATAITLLLSGTAACALVASRLSVSPFSSALLPWLLVTAGMCGALASMPAASLPWLDAGMRILFVLSAYGAMCRYTGLRWQWDA